MMNKNHVTRDELPRSLVSLLAFETLIYNHL